MGRTVLSEVQQAQMTAKAARLLREEDDDVVTALQRLAEAFPSLDAAKGVDPWDRSELEVWSEGADANAKHSARFVLSVEEPEDTAFDLHAAMSEWGEIERVVFTVWAMKPWWA